MAKYIDGFVLMVPKGKEAEEEADDEELEEVRRRGLYDQDRDGYAPEEG